MVIRCIKSYKTILWEIIVDNNEVLIVSSAYLVKEIKLKDVV